MSGVIQRRDAIDRQSSPLASATSFPACRSRADRKPTLVESRSAESCPRRPPVRRRCDQFRSPVPEWTLDQAQSALPVGINHGNPRRAVVDVKPRPHCSPGFLPLTSVSARPSLQNEMPAHACEGGRDWTMGAQPVRELSKGHTDRRCCRDHRVDVAPD